MPVTPMVLLRPLILCVIVMEVRGNAFRPRHRQSAYSGNDLHMGNVNVILRKRLLGRLTLWIVLDIFRHREIHNHGND